MRAPRGAPTALAVALAAGASAPSRAANASSRCLQPIRGSDGVEAYKFANKDNFDIVLDDSQWPTSTMNVLIAKIILEEHMGYRVSFKASGGLDSWEPISKGEVHANLEVWESELEKTYNAQYISGAHTVEDLGALGVVARNGWYVPTTFAMQFPYMSTYLGLRNQDALDELKYERVEGAYVLNTSLKSAYFVGPPVFWAPKKAEEQIADNLDLPLSIHYAQDYSEYLNSMLDCLERRNGHNGKCIMYNYFPSTIKSGYNISRVSLPEHTSECYAKGDEGGIDCDYDYFILYKIAWAQLDSYAPDAYQVLQQFKLTKNDQEAMLADVMNGMGYYEIACEWIQNNQERWTSWIPLDFADYDPPAPTPQAEETPKWLFILLYVLAGLLAAIILLLFVAWLAWTVNSKKKLQKQVRRNLEARMLDCKACLKRLAFPMYIVCGTDWTQLPEITIHETLRDRGELKVLDDLDVIVRFQDQMNKIVFFSHQWLAWAHPDPQGKQWKVMRHAVQFLANKDSTPMDHMWAWVDYSGIPQKNRSAQALAIGALTNYAANSNYFVVVAPSAEHMDCSQVQDLSTYNDRMWCRAEQMSRISNRGMRDFYLADESGVLTGVERLGSQRAWDEYLDDTLRVFDGTASCCSLKHRLEKKTLACDREKLVIPMMSLMASMHAQIKLNLFHLDEDSELVVTKLHSKLDEMFPKYFTYEKEGEGAFRRVLFGDVVPYVLQDVDANPNSWLGPGRNTLRATEDDVCGHLSIADHDLGEPPPFSLADPHPSESPSYPIGFSEEAHYEAPPEAPPESLRPILSLPCHSKCSD